jgi:hypothetical protein
MDLARVYIGLNDLHIDLKLDNLFEPLADGTVQRFRESYAGRFGVAGFTHPARGRPISCRLLLAEMARLGCSFAVARRSFRADVPAPEIAEAISAVRSCHADLRRRDTASILRDQADLQTMLASLRAAPSPHPFAVS